MLFLSAGRIASINYMSCKVSILRSSLFSGIREFLSVPDISIVGMALALNNAALVKIQAEELLALQAQLNSTLNL